MDIQDKTICDIVREAEDNYVDGSTQISKYVDFSLYENIEKIDSYLNSKHTSGEVDSMGRDKPFFDIVSAATNIWYRATDIDRSNIKIRATKSSDDLVAFLATVHIQDWMRREQFGTFLNKWGMSLSRYGSSIVKFVDNSQGLVPQVMSWNRMIIDPVDFDNNIKIEILELTEAQLRNKKGYDQEIVNKLILTKTARETAGGQDKDNRSNYIKLYEVHGLLPKSYLTDRDEDEDVFVDQMHVVSFVESKEDGEYDDFTLISGQEAKCPYMITHLIEEEGRSQSRGAVERLFEAQWMANHSIKAIKDQLDLSSKIIFQTSDGNFVGQNALKAVETGDILIHAPNEPLTELNNSSNDITALQNFNQMWKALGQELTSTPDALMGATAPSGTAWRQVEALQSEAHSLFELMTENKGLHIEDMFRKYVIPYIKKKMDTSDEISSTLKDYDLKKIDSKYVKSVATELTNKMLVDMVLNDEKPTPEDQIILNSVVSNGIQATLNEFGNTRYFVPSKVSNKTWKDIVKDLEWDVEVDVTGEPKDLKSVMATLNTALQTVASLGGQPMPPDMKLVFNRILELSGAISPIELQGIPESSQEIPQAPVDNQAPPLPTNQ